MKVSKNKKWNEIKTSDSWSIFKIMGEFVEGYEKLSAIGPCISIFGSARTKPEDKYYKLANQFYGRPGLWWIIALYNKKPTEGHLRRGDIVEIPTPIELVLYYI